MIRWGKGIHKACRWYDKMNEWQMMKVVVQASEKISRGLCFYQFLYTYMIKSTFITLCNVGECQEKEKQILHTYIPCSDGKSQTMSKYGPVIKY